MTTGLPAQAGTVVPLIPRRQHDNSARQLPIQSATTSQARAWIEDMEANRSLTGSLTAPAEIAAALPGLAAELEAIARPADPMEYGVLMEKLLRFVSDFGLPIGNLKSVAATYRETLCDLPPDLLAQAIDRIIQTHKYHVLPKPAEIRAHVTAELIDRKNRLRAAREALNRI